MFSFFLLLKKVPQTDQFSGFSLVPPPSFHTLPATDNPLLILSGQEKPNILFKHEPCHIKLTGSRPIGLKLKPWLLCDIWSVPLCLL